MVSRAESEPTRAESDDDNNNNNCLWCYHHDHCHCESSPGSFDECRLSAGWPPAPRPSQVTWAVSPPKFGSYYFSQSVS